MEIIADLHLHGRFSRATSKDLTIKNLEKYARIKGNTLMGTGDFTHPLWIKELKQELTEDGSGILRTATGFQFMLTTEISLIYTQDGKGRRIHHVVWAPNFEVVDQITAYLKSKGRIDYDGRPIFNISSDAFVEKLKEINQDIEVIPAHAWTPYFGIFGSMTGFDTLKDCFKDQTKHIYAIETGLSSDPPMNWRLSQLDKYALVSFSDLHSYWPWRIGRESTIFKVNQFTYKNIIQGLHSKEGIAATIEVDPGYGKYHFDGHSACKVCMHPSESKKAHGICPACGKKMTIGVLNRVEQLADRPEGYMPKSPLPFYSLIPLSEILSAAIGKAIATKAVWQEYNKLVTPERNELEVLRETPQEMLEKLTSARITDMIMRNRQGKIAVEPGYDGAYGIPLFEQKKEDKNEEKKKKEIAKPRQVQKGLGEFS